MVYPGPEGRISHCVVVQAWVYRQPEGKTHLAPGNFEGGGGTTAELPNVVFDVDVGLADDVLDFVNSGFYLPVLEDGRAGWGRLFHFPSLVVVVEGRALPPAATVLAGDKKKGGTGKRT